MKVYQGSVIWFKNVFGFIEWSKDGEKQKDMFVHFSDIVQEEGYRTLKAGQKVEFEIGENFKKDPKAVNVKVK